MLGHTIGRAALVVGALALLLALALGVARGSGVTPTNTWMNLYSSHSTFAGAPIPTGAYVAVYDPQMTQCGEFTVTIAGKYGIMPCYGDDPTTGGDDEGPLSGERLSFTINGAAVTPQPVARNGTPVPAGTPVTWSSGDRWQVNLILPPRPPVTITLLTNQLRLDWSFAGAEITTYEIWRSTTPYFAPGDPDAERRKAVPSAGPLNWAETGGLGDPTVNYTYRVRSLNVLSQTVGMSQAVGEFEFTLVH
ncbi:MAG: hypothetical protein NT169_28390 [Chloroflexi bacterium]|nr:hypothetical protein [Chloroflexota bacterium]